MLRRLIERPVAVTMTVIAILVVGMVSFGRLPVSLMPAVDIPQVTVQVEMPGASAREVDQTVIQPLRSQLLQTPSLQDMKCDAKNDGGSIFMQFEYGSDADFNYIEVNEKVDRALQWLPDGVERPKIIKASATDIPVFFLDVTSKDSSIEGFIELSRFSKEVISKRIEQIPEVAFVDMSGLLGSRLLIEPDLEKLSSLGLDASYLVNSLLNNNVSLGNLIIQDGHYQWNIRFDSEIRSKEDIENIRMKIDGRIFLFKDLASVSLTPEEVRGIVRSDGRRAVTMAVIKQSDAQMSLLKKNLSELMDAFSADYPDLSFTVSRNQTELLDYSINNLKGNIIVGALLAILVLILFMRDFRSPMLVAITIPLSLVMSMLLLYLLGISINIISLSGLILGIGMMVDNSIIVIDNITQYWEAGNSLKSAAVNATREVVGSMLSSVLTTCSVFVPLIFLSGIAGSLFYDQAMAVTITLFTSLLVSVIVIPVYFCLFYRNQKCVAINKHLSRFQRWDYYLLYERALKWAFRHQTAVWCIFSAMVVGTIVMFSVLDKAKLPNIIHDDIMLKIDWNEPLSIEESDARSLSLIDGLNELIAQSDILIGQQNFVLSHTEDIDQSQILLYLKAASSDGLAKLETIISERIKRMSPFATWSFSQSANIFNMLFSDNEPDLVAMIQSEGGSFSDLEHLNAFIDKVRAEVPEIYLEPVSWQEQILYVTDREKMAIYGIDYSTINSALRTATHQNSIFSIRSGSISIPVVIGDRNSLDLLSVQVTSADGTQVPLSYVVSERRVRDLKSIVSGKDGNFYPLNISANNRQIPSIMKKISNLLKDGEEYSIVYSGAYFSGRSMIKELAVVLIISILLLFFILAAQFESLVQPVIIMSEICADIFGALLALYICGAGINIMSLIGIVVMCGVVINDSILKVDTINQHRRSGTSLLRAIMLGGKRRLKPIIMTSLTTILAIAPSLERGTMGTDLQFPLSVALIGGMIVGTMVSILFVPVFYFEIYRRKQ